VDLQWILDRLFEAGKIAASQTTRLDHLEEDVGHLNGLFDRVKTIEERDSGDLERKRVTPQYGMLIACVVSALAAIASVVISVFTLTQHRVP
jgi:hypothetical protein